MDSLSKMYGTYDATCWLNRPRKELNGKNAAEAIRDGDEQIVFNLIKKESRYKKIAKSKR
tara:strand:- start:185 stop:364 length:180 start_codon:yes stop_codon:yes gene_type:complete